MILNKIEDPRDNLQKLHRRELVEIARANGLADITENMPADDVEGVPGTGIRSLLRAKGITRAPALGRTLGAQKPERTFPLQAQSKVPQPGIDQDELRRFREWQAQQNKPQPTVAPMTMAELRKTCKARGIKMDRKDNMQTLRAKLG